MGRPRPVDSCGFDYAKVSLFFPFMLIFLTKKKKRITQETMHSKPTVVPCAEDRKLWAVPRGEHFKKHFPRRSGEAWHLVKPMQVITHGNANYTLVGLRGSSRPFDMNEASGIHNYDLVPSSQLLEFLQVSPQSLKSGDKVLSFPFEDDDFLLEGTVGKVGKTRTTIFFPSSNKSKQVNLEDIFVLKK